WPWRSYISRRILSQKHPFVRSIIECHRLLSADPSTLRSGEHHLRPGVPTLACAGLLVPFHNVMLADSLLQVPRRIDNVLSDHSDQRNAGFYCLSTPTVRSMEVQAPACAEARLVDHIRRRYLCHRLLSNLPRLESVPLYRNPFTKLRHHLGSSRIVGFRDRGGTLALPCASASALSVYFPCFRRAHSEERSFG
ncbi:uncharacterized protein CC84DRAFT_1226361, partial [Paraphaeosphaeria sporulosa]